MDSEMLRQGTARGPVGSLPFIVALVLANVLASPRLDTYRPDSTPLEWIPVATEEQLPGRLWQDPLQLAYEAWAEVRGDEVAVAELQHALAEPDALPEYGEPDESDAPRPQARGTPKQVRPARALAVMVRGGSFPEDREKRLRSRYAVVAGFGSRGYVPTDDQHIGFTAIDVDLDGGIEEPFRTTSGKDSGALDGRTSSELVGRADPLVLAFEWFNDGKEDVLVLWVDELALGLHPLYRLDALCHRLRDLRPSLGKIQILGPTSTTGLVRMRADDLTMWLGTPWDLGFLPARNASRALDGVEVYSPWGTIDDEALYGEGADPSNWLSGLRLFRTIGQDSTLTRLLYKELQLRIPTLAHDRGGFFSQTLSGVLRATQMLQVEESARVLLVTEADTEYGRSWSKLFEAHTVQHDMLQYLRGIDGKVPGRKAFADKPPKNGEDGAEATAPTGVGQFDYLERLDRSLEERPYDAIGVLGSDVYDKLAILKVLKRRFPQAVLFTTDLDARLFPTKAAPETMNVVVASHYGLTQPVEDSSEPNQAPFRSGYQTAIWNSTRMVLDNCRAGPLEAGCKCKVPAASVYEIGRHRAYTLKRCSEPASDGTPAEGGGADGAVAATADEPGAPHWPVHQTATEWFAGVAFLLFLALGAMALVRPVRQDGTVKRQWARIGKACAAAERRVTDLVTGASDRLRPLSKPFDGAWGRIVRWPGWKTLRERASAPSVWIVVVLVAITGIKAFSSPFGTVEAKSVFETSRIGEREAGSGDELMGLLTVVLVLAYCLFLFRPVRRSVGGFFSYEEKPPRSRVLAASVTLVLAVASCFAVAHFVRVPQAGGEPFELFAGISIWPTEVLRFVAVLYCGFALLKVWGDTVRMCNYVNEKYLLEKVLPPPAKLEKRLGRFGLFAKRTFDKEATSICGAWRDYLADGMFAPRMLRVVVGAFGFYVLSGLMFMQLGAPSVPYRGWPSFLFDRLMLFLSVAGMMLLIFLVLDVTLTTARFLQRVRYGEDRIWRKLAARHAADTGLRADDVSEVVGVRLVERMTSTIGNFLYYPAVMLFLMMLSRSSLFDHWTWSPALILVFVFSFALLFGATRYIAWVARATREEALVRLRRDRLKHQREKERVSELDNSMGVIERIDGGAFAGFRDHPLTKAVLLPFAGLGMASLLEFVYPLWLGL